VTVPLEYIDFVLQAVDESRGGEVCFHFAHDNFKGLDYYVDLFVNNVQLLLELGTFYSRRFIVLLSPLSMWACLDRTANI